MHRPLARITTVLGALLIAACRDGTAPGVPLASIRSVVPDTTVNGDIRLEYALTTTSAIDIEYWDTPTHRLRLHRDAAPAKGSVALAQLRAGQQYQYSLTVTDGRGRTGDKRTGEFATPGLPDDLLQTTFTATGTATSRLTMLELNDAYQGFVAVDDVGRPVWRWRTHGAPQGFTRRANGNFVFNDVGSGLFEVTVDGGVVHELPPLPAGARVPHHDVIATPANTILFIAQETRGAITGDCIWEWNPETGEATQRFSVFDFYDPAVDWAARSLTYDWVHANSLALGDHGNVILSLNWLDQVISIAPDWQSIEWKAGGRASTFAFDAGVAFQGQHTASLLPDGHLLLFDNGRDRTGDQRYSRGLELALDRRAGTAHVVWAFRPTPDIYAPYVGATQRLANGNTLVFFGLPSGFSGGATGPLAGYEVRPDGAVAWSITVGNVKSVYRATPMTSIAGEVAVR
ncbi:hypothetical protein BH11GEM1_BH11GEM1_24840 [soil metagenome]